MQHYFYDNSKTGKAYFAYEMSRGCRKTIQVAIMPDGTICVKAPYRMSQEAIQRFLKEKSTWILEHTEKIRKERLEYPEQTFREGDQFLYLGNRYRLKIQTGNTEDVCLSGNFLMMNETVKTKNRRKEVLEQWYRKRAKEYIEKRVRIFSVEMGEIPNRITIKTQKNRWGSCSSRRNLNFNWKLIMLPREEIDYVIVHELCHLREMNHSAAFWKEVEHVMPDYKIRRKWLRDNAWKVEWEQI